MSFYLPPLSEYLTVAERQNIEDAFIAAGVVYDDVTRRRLLDGVNRFYSIYHLPDNVGTSWDQLSEDLRRMNLVPRLADGSIPLAQWLRNSVRRFNTLPQKQLLETLLGKVVGSGETTTATIEPADIPSADYEEIITDGIDDLQDTSFLSIGSIRLNAVAKILVPRFQGGKQILLPDQKSPYYGAGTGWLIGSDLLMTNYHVVRNRLQTEEAPADSDLLLQALNSQAQFFYEYAEQEGTKVGVTNMIAVGKTRQKDFALLRLKEKVNVKVLPVLDQKVEIPQTEFTPKGAIVKALAVNIIQHPGGGPKRVALRNNLVYAADYPQLHYFTDTLSGSSGSPVFDDTWRVVALHRAAVQKTAEFHGKTLGYVNEGIQIHAILAELTRMAEVEPEVALALTQINDEQSIFSDGP